MERDPTLSNLHRPGQESSLYAYRLSEIVYNFIEIESGFNEFPKLAYLKLLVWLTTAGFSLIAYEHIFNHASAQCSVLHRAIKISGHIHNFGI